MIEAQPGAMIDIPAGVHNITRSLSLTVDGVTLRGVGMNASILSFRNQLQGAEGLLVNADNFTIRNVRTKWASGPLTGMPINDPTYDPYPGSIHIHDNTFIGGGTIPDKPSLLELQAATNGSAIPEIVWDGFIAANTLFADQAHKLHNVWIPPGQVSVTKGGLQPLSVVRHRLATMTLAADGTTALQQWQTLCWLNELPETPAVHGAD